MKLTALILTLVFLSGQSIAGSADDFYHTFKVSDTQIIKDKDINQVKENDAKTGKLELVGIKLAFKLNGTVVFNHE